MAMLTTCPACRTRFRVTPEQLAAHRGDVRCGRCAKVFNAHAYLEHEPEELEPEVLEPEAFEPEDELDAQVEDFTAEEAIPPPVEEAPPAGEEPEPSLAEPVDEVPIDAVKPEPLPETEEPLPAVAEPAATEAGETAVEAESAPVPPVVAISPVEEEVEAPKKKRSFFWLWLAGIILLLVGLGFQGLYGFRTELASRYPDFKPFLQQLCGCTIRLPANPDMLSIETSNLEADPNQANLVVLNAILRNRAKVAQEYPLLELTLTDTQDKMIARRIFPPTEYAKNADLNRGMPPNEEVTVKLHLDLGDLKAAGYRVFLFYQQ